MTRGFAALAGALAVLTLAATLVFAGGDAVPGEPVAAPRAPASSPSSSVSAPPSTTRPWHVVTVREVWNGRDVTFEVPPDWEVHGGEPVYRPGYCPGQSDSFLGLVSLSEARADDPSTAVEQRLEELLRGPFAGRGASVDLGEVSGDRTSRLIREARITTARTGPCDAEVTAIHLLGVLHKDGKGCLLFEVRADQDVPDAAPESDLRRIVSSVRFT